MYLYIYTRNIHVYSSTAANNYVHQHIYRYQIYTCFVFLFEDIQYRELNVWRLLWCEPFVWIKSSNKLSPKNRDIILWCLKNPHQYWDVHWLGFAGVCGEFFTKTTASAFSHQNAFWLCSDFHENTSVLASSAFATLLGKYSQTDIKQQKEPCG